MAKTGFEEFFTRDNIIACLCRERLATRTRLHEDNYLAHLAPGLSSSLSSPRHEILGYLPPRSRWFRPPKAGRAKGTFHEMMGSLRLTVRKLRKSNKPTDRDWIQRQDRIIAAIRFRALSSHRVEFARPRVTPSPKHDSSGDYRVLASYELEDKILIGQCAAYLRAIFEAYFLPCSFAFRFPTNGNALPTHHDAFRALANFWTTNQVRGCVDAWVSECDIQGFFDAVCHQIVLREFDKAVNRLATQGFYIDTRSRILILAYLRSYSYAGYAVPAARKALKRIDPSGSVKDRTEAIKGFHKNLDRSRIGVPQGGALSCFFANLMLHSADEAMVEIVTEDPSNMTYVRYCDDMVIVGGDRSAVEEAVKKYCDTLRLLKLPTHQLTSVAYGRDFWKVKSKAPYRWTRNASDETVPWLAFVGYHLRYDGMLRIRPSSIKKELEKQVRVTDRFLAHVVPALKNGRVYRNRRRMMASLTGRLEAMSVGRRSEWDFDWNEPSECWSSGFKCRSFEMLPRNQKILWTQLRRLDRNKGRQLARAKRKLSRFCRNLGRRAQNRRSVTPYSGKPKSYAGQFEQSRLT